MREAIGSVQFLFLGIVLAWSGGYKLTARAATASSHPALANLVGRHRVTVVVRTVGVVELVAAVLLLAPTHLRWAPWLVVGLAIGFLVYLGHARVAVPQSACGCMSASREPITWRHFARAGLLLAAALTAVRAPDPWFMAMLDDPLRLTAILGGQSVALVALSPDLDDPIRHGLRRPRQWLRPLALRATIAQLRQSPIYSAHGHLVRSGVQDAWDVGDWRALSFVGHREDGGSEPLTIVFAVPKRYAPHLVRMAILDDTDRGLTRPI